MQLNFLQEDLLAAMQKNPPPAVPVIALQKKPAQPAKPVQISLLPDAPVTEPKAVRKALAKSVAPKSDHAEEKAPSAFKTISEAADILGVPTHVLRFWESQFVQISPTKSRGGRRYYRPEDMHILTTIKHLLYKQGYTIKGARKAMAHLKEGEALDAVAVAMPVAKPLLSDKQKAQLAAIRSELLGLKQQLTPYLA